MMVLLTVLMVAELAAPAADATARSDTYETVGSNNERQGHFAECGCSMLAAAEAQPDSPRHAERLWKAGQCFENAHLTNRATASWLAEIQAHPKDPFARKATARLARRYRDLCYDCDSDSPYPQTPSLPDESREFKEARDAAMFRDIGLPEQSLARLELYAKSRGARQPGAVARAYFEMVAVYEREQRPELLTAHLERYLRRWARFDTRDRRLRAHFVLGEVLWKASCRTTSEKGTCTHRRVVAAAAAQAHFRLAVKLWKGGEAVNGIAGIEAESRTSEATNAAAGALFYIAENEYEDALQVDGARFPRRLATVLPTYQRVVELHTAPWVAAAAARLGQLYASTTDATTKAVEAFELCLATATARDDQWAALCDRELNRLNHSRSAAASEVVSAAAYEPPIRLSPTPPVMVTVWLDPCPDWQESFLRR
jgi:hypothetical protein